MFFPVHIEMKILHTSTVPPVKASVEKTKEPFRRKYSKKEQFFTKKTF